MRKILKFIEIIWNDYPFDGTLDKRSEFTVNATEEIKDIINAISSKKIIKNSYNFVMRASLLSRDLCISASSKEE